MPRGKTHFSVAEKAGGLGAAVWYSGMEPMLCNREPNVAPCGPHYQKKHYRLTIWWDRVSCKACLRLGAKKGMITPL